MAIPAYLRDIIAHTREVAHLSDSALDELLDVLQDWKDGNIILSGEDLKEFLAGLAKIRIEPLIQHIQTLKRFGPSNIDTNPICRTSVDKLGQVILRGESLERANRAILFLDLKGFTSASSKVAAKSIIQRVLNPVWQLVQEIVTRFGGWTEKYIGDATMIVLDDNPNFPEHLATRAIQMGAAIARHLNANPEAFAVTARDGSRVTLTYRIGVSYGEVVHGLVGTESHCELTEIGTPVNSAARAESGNNELHTKVLVTEACWEASKYADLMHAVLLANTESQGAMEILQREIGLARYMPRASAKGIGRIHYWQVNLNNKQKETIHTYTKGYRTLVKGGKNQFMEGAAPYFLDAFLVSLKGTHDAISEHARQMLDRPGASEHRDAIKDSLRRVLGFVKLSEHWPGMDQERRRETTDHVIRQRSALALAEDHYADDLLVGVDADFPPLLHLVDITRHSRKQDSISLSKVGAKQEERSRQSEG